MNITKRRLLATIAAVLIILLALLVVGLRQAGAPAPVDDQASSTVRSEISTNTPRLKAEVLVSGRQNVWDVTFLPATGNGGPSMLFGERRGSISLYRDGTVRQLATITDVQARGEGGLMGLVADPRFAANRQVYTCLNSTAGDIRVVRWKLADDLSGLRERQDIVTGISANPSGRHSGCRLAFGPDGYLWVGTGDSASADQPQQPRSLNGKILRVDSDGRAANGNLGGNFDARIYSYGHRNTQGIAFFTKPKAGVLGVSAEHGSEIDDEVNPLSKGNFGWAPAAGYDETGLSMTDTRRFPEAIQAIWSSGRATQAPSGVAILNGSRWQGWDGAVALAMLKDKHLKILRLDAANKVTKEERIVEGEYGRIRSVVQAPDGDLYLTTDNDSDDKIIRLTPQ